MTTRDRLRLTVEAGDRLADDDYLPAEDDMLMAGDHRALLGLVEAAKAYQDAWDRYTYGNPVKHVNTYDAACRGLRAAVEKVTT